MYGQTGCGKSFTMEGSKIANSPQKGVISRAFEHIFEAIAVTTGIKYLALVSYLEIYNEQIRWVICLIDLTLLIKVYKYSLCYRDLLLPSEKMTSTPLTLKETPNEGVTVPGRVFFLIFYGFVIVFTYRCTKNHSPNMKR